ncbi:MAG TPA: thioredoxin family protein [Syntrophales bacterium]|nr:thioredoxin family protein [Syntrophales bacterium]
MSEREIVQVRVEGALVGIVGLTAIMKELTTDRTGRTDEEIREELLRRAGEGNYIPRKARDAYGKALLREFRKFRGEAVEEEVLPGTQVRILGPGCTRCWQLERDVRDVMAELGLAGDLVHVDDLKEIARSGVMGAPALVVNGKVLAVGTVPSKADIRKWLTQMAKEDT